MKVVIDPGHGGADIGGCGLNSHESDIVLNIGLQLREILTPYVEVVMTRDTDVFIPLAERVRISNDSKADLVLSLHTNAAANRMAHGWEVFSSVGLTEGDRLASCIAARHAEAFPSQNVRGIKQADFYMLRKTSAPACLWEAGFLTNSDEEEFLTSPDTQSEMAQALSLGILDFLNISPNEPELSLEERIARIENHLNLA